MPEPSPYSARPPGFTGSAIRTGFFLVLVLVLVTGFCFYRSRINEAANSKRLGLYLEHAEGLAVGSPVTTAGVPVGKVTAIDVPVPVRERPAVTGENPSPYEVRVVLEVSASARIFRRSKISIGSSLLGSAAIDFTGGDESSGLAEPGWHFVGPRREPVVSLSDLLDRLPARPAAVAPSPATISPR